MSRAEYLRTWRAAYPHKVRGYSANARRKAGSVPRPSPPEQTAAERKRIYDREYHRARRAAAPEPIAEACAFCRLGPCKGMCDAC